MFAPKRMVHLNLGTCSRRLNSYRIKPLNSIAVIRTSTGVIIL